MSDTFWATIISAMLVLAGTVLTIRVKRSESRADQATAGFNAQLLGWDTYSKSLRARIDELEGEADRYRKRAQETQIQNDTLEARCDELLDEAIKLRRENTALKYDAEQRKKDPPA